MQGAAVSEAPNNRDRAGDAACLSLLVPRLSPQPTGSNVELGLRYSFKLQYQHKDRFLVLIVSFADTGCK